MPCGDTPCSTHPKTIGVPGKYFHHIHTLTHILELTSDIQGIEMFMLTVIPQHGHTVSPSHRTAIFLSHIHLLLQKIYHIFYFQKMYPIFCCTKHLLQV